MAGCAAASCLPAASCCCCVDRAAPAEENTLRTDNKHAGTVQGYRAENSGLLLLVYRDDEQKLMDPKPALHDSPVVCLAECAKANLAATPPFYRLTFLLHPCSAV
jgi:hypothetical protein